MLPWTERLRLRSDFATIYKRGRVYHNTYLKLYVCPLLGESAKRAGFIVSKVVSKKAVVRNRLKRRIREAYSQLSPNIKLGYMLLFVAKKTCVGAEFLVIENSLQKLVELALVYEPKSACMAY